MRLKENDMLSKLRNLDMKNLPFEIRNVLTEASFVDAKLSFFIPDGPSFVKSIELVPLATPKILKEKISFLRTRKEFALSDTPMIVAPFINREQAKMLAAANFSWMDLCGNMGIKEGKTIFIERLGNPNQYPDTASIKKIFEGISSLVSRALLLQPKDFTKQEDIVTFINTRNANITLGTVSKVLTVLEDELLVTKERGRICATDRGELLRSLKNAYVRSSKRITKKQIKYVCDNVEYLVSILSSKNVDYAACRFYAAQIRGLATTETKEFYVKNINDITQALESQVFKLVEDSEFGNLVLIESDDPAVWFNIEQKNNIVTVDDIELFLEMSAETPRGPKVARQLEEQILKGTTNE